MGNTGHFKHHISGGLLFGNRNQDKREEDMAGVRGGFQPQFQIHVLLTPLCLYLIQHCTAPCCLQVTLHFHRNPGVEQSLVHSSIFQSGKLGLREIEMTSPRLHGDCVATVTRTGPDPKSRLDLCRALGHPEQVSQTTETSSPRPGGWQSKAKCGGADSFPG